MAYVTCPWCLTPEQVADEEPGYRCLTCGAEVRFFRCPECGFVQTVNKQWTMFVCGKCEKTIDLPDGFIKDSASKMEKVTLDQANAALRRFLKPDRLTITVVGTAVKLMFTLPS